MDIGHQQPMPHHDSIKGLGRSWAPQRYGCLISVQNRGLLTWQGGNWVSDRQQQLPRTSKCSSLLRLPTNRREQVQLHGKQVFFLALSVHYSPPPPHILSAGSSRTMSINHASGDRLMTLVFTEGSDHLGDLEHRTFHPHQIHSGWGGAMILKVICTVLIYPPLSK